MPARTRATAFTRFLFVLILMAALYFGVQYALTQTDWGRDLHEDIQEVVPADEPNR